MVSEVNFPEQTLLHGKEEDSFYRDAFLVNPTRSNLPAKYVYHSVFGHFPNFILSFYRIRNRIARLFNRSEVSYPTYFSYNDIYQGGKIDFVTFEKISAAEVVVVANEKNMDIWVSVLRVSDRRFIISTLINFKSKKGRIYMRLIRPLHQMATKYCIRQAIKARRL